MDEEERLREEISRINHQIPIGSTELVDCAARVLLVFAEVLECVLVVKEKGDDLHPAWPEGSIVAIRATDPRPTLEDAIVKEVRRVRDHFEIPLPDVAILVAHFEDMRARGREPVASPREFLAAVKRLFPHGIGRRLARRRTVEGPILLDRRQIGQLRCPRA